MKTARRGASACLPAFATVEGGQNSFGGGSVDIGEFFSMYSGDIIGFVLSLIAALFAFLAQKRLKNLQKEVKGQKGQTTAENEEVTALSAVSEINQEEDDTMKFTAEYSVSLEVTVVSKNATTVLTVKKADGTVLSGAEAVKALEEIVVAAQGV